MKNILVTLTILVACSFFTICNYPKSNIVSTTYQDPQSQPRKMIEIRGSIVEDKISLWKMRQIPLKCKENLHLVSFSDANHGIVVGLGGAIYKTVDGGRNWPAMSINALNDMHVASLSLISPTYFWALATSNLPSYETKNRPPNLLLSTADGGMDWKRTPSLSGMETRRIYFISELEGWALGSSLFYTDNGGESWGSLMDNLSRDVPGYKTADLILDFYISSNAKSITILMRDGRFAQSTDRGDTWKIISQTDDPSRGYNQVIKMGGTEYNRIWVAIGADSREGFRGELQLFDPAGEQTVYWVESVYFTDVVFLSKSEILASGKILPTPRSLGYWDKRDGVILYSNDGGNQWEVVYRSADTKIINSLAMIDRNHIWAVGKNRTLLHLSR